MSYKHQRIDRIMLAVSLFTVTGAILAYNLHTVNGGELALSLSDLSEALHPTASAVSESAAANLNVRESVFTAAEPSTPPHVQTLPEPIVRMP